MILKIVISLVLALLSALFYRFGGIGKPFKSWMRDWICPAFSIGTLLLWWQPAIWWGWLMILPAYGLMGGALTTYLDSIFGYDNFWAAGFLVAISFFPFAFVGIHWYAILIRAIALGVLWGGWCKIFGNDILEETGRGAFIVLTIPILVI